MTADLWYERIGGGDTPHPFAVTHFREDAPALSPDGKWLAFESSEAGGSRVFVAPFPSGTPRQVVSFGDNSWSPRWAGDGRTLFYIDHGTLIAARLATGGAMSVVRPDTVMRAGSNLGGGGHAAYDVAPDGRHILYVDAKRDVSGLIVAYDWRKEFRALVTRRGKRSGS